jgi:pilus assembly protein Flp/PilA
MDVVVLSGLSAWRSRLGKRHLHGWKRARSNPEQLVTRDYSGAADHPIRQSWNLGRVLLDGSLWARTGLIAQTTKGKEMLEKFITFMLVGRDEEKGATAVEYGLLVALIAAVIVVVVGLLGGEINAAFQTIVNALP